MSNARKLADNLPREGQLGSRNRIMNGSMEVAQRAASSTSYGYVSLDRWYVNQSGGSTTFSQETNSNPSETGGLKKYARLNVSSSSDYTGIFQRIEDVTSVPEGTVTISFYAKGTAPTGGVKVWASQVFGSGGSSDVNIAEQVIASSLTSSWVRYTLNMTVPSVDGKTIGANNSFTIVIGQGTDTASTAYDLNITGIQLEVGSQATPFEHEPYDTTLEKCQRYFQKSGDGRTYGVVFNQHTATNAYSCMRWWKPMRVAPTIYSMSTSNYNMYNTGYSRSFSQVGISQLSENSGEFYLTTSSLTAGQATHLNTNGDLTMWKADAELP